MYITKSFNVVYYVGECGIEEVRHKSRASRH